MSDIAIVTFHRACNYGAFLQAYALQETLNQYEDVNAYLFDYRSEIIESRYKPDFYLRRAGNPLKKLCKFLIEYGEIQKRNSIFASSREKCYRYKVKNISRQEVIKASEAYDAFVVGSDQVWNRDIVKEDNTFFLDFVKPSVMKFSYAASLGKRSLSDAELQDLAEMVSDYNGISVRESDVVPLLEQMKHLPPICSSLDPVFLFDAGQWRKFSVHQERKPYVLFFMMGQSDNAIPAMRFAKELAGKAGLDVVYLSDSERWYKFREFTHFGVASPEEFVGLIDHAEYVVTNSFHATAFSIILHKKFFVETEVLRSNRILNLLEVAGLQQCGLVKGNCKQPEKEIDWLFVEKNLAPFIDDSKKYITGMMDQIQSEEKR
ncbi:MAG: polysaccharide pyruvyl transferase family protein [Clostridiales bacterium]|nr:polysaccharide pyruvyl transferase family protein [Clostridiales bacterium]